MPNRDALTEADYYPNAAEHLAICLGFDAGLTPAA
jgi:hypothetical protein